MPSNYWTRITENFVMFLATKNERTFTNNTIGTHYTKTTNNKTKQKS
jgi:hypothetical protein